MKDALEKSLLELVNVLRKAIEAGMDNIPEAATFLLNQLVMFYTVWAVGWFLLAFAFSFGAYTLGRAAAKYHTSGKIRSPDGLVDNHNMVLFILLYGSTITCGFAALYGFTNAWGWLVRAIAPIGALLFKAL